MEFALEETQQEIKDLTAQVLAREVGDSNPTQHGSLTASKAETSYNESVWKAFADAGLLSLAVPERLGGAGLGALDSAVVLSEVGRHAVSVPALATVALGVLPVQNLGTAEQQERVLTGVDAGRVLTAALNETSAPMPSSPRTLARRDSDSFVVSGTKIDVPYAEVAEEILVSVSIEDAGSLEEAGSTDRAGVVLIDPAAAGVSITRTHSSSGDSSWVVHLNEVRVSDSDLLGGSVEPDVLRRVHEFAVAGICAVADGAVAGALNLTSEHLRTRTQFGQPLAAFQAVAQQVADVYVAARTMHLATMSACWRLSDGRDAGEDLDVAALWLTDELPPALHACHHMHGGVGVDVTYPMHRYFSLIRDLSRLLGGFEHRLDQLADRLPAA